MKRHVDKTKIYEKRRRYLKRDVDKRVFTNTLPHPQQSNLRAQDVDLWKETWICEKRRTYMKRGVHKT